MANTLTLKYGNGALIVGEGTLADKSGQDAKSNGNILVDGDAQTSQYILRGATVDGTPASIYLDGISEKLTISPYSSWVYNANIVARRTDGLNESAGYSVSGVISRDYLASTTTIVGSNKTVLGESSVAWDANVVADTTNGALNVEVTGENGKSINWVASINTVETLAYVEDVSSSSSSDSSDSSDSSSNSSSSIDSSSSESAIVENKRIEMQGTSSAYAKTTNSLVIPAMSKSVSIWYTQTAHSQNWSPLFSSSVGGSPAFSICGDVAATSKIRFFNGGSTTDSLATVPLGQNIHLVMTHDGAILKIYINGVLDTSLAFAWGGSTGIAGLGWNVWDNGGSGPADTFQHNGKIDEINVWDRELNQTEITDLYNGGVGRKANLSVAPWNSGFNVGWHFDDSADPTPNSIGADLPFDVVANGSLVYVESDVCIS